MAIVPRTVGVSYASEDIHFGHASQALGTGVSREHMLEINGGRGRGRVQQTFLPGSFCLGGVLKASCRLRSSVMTEKSS